MGSEGDLERGGQGVAHPRNRALESRSGNNAATKAAQQSSRPRATALVGREAIDPGELERPDGRARAVSIRPRFQTKLTTRTHRLSFPATLHNVLEYGKQNAIPLARSRSGTT